MNAIKRGYGGNLDEMFGHEIYVACMHTYIHT
jgi:hypothetical protein